jgi:hypothetical protein
MEAKLALEPKKTISNGFPKLTGGGNRLGEDNTLLPGFEHKLGDQSPKGTEAQDEKDREETD